MIQSCLPLFGLAVFMVTFFSFVWVSALPFVLKGYFLTSYLFSLGVFIDSICLPEFVFINRTIKILLDSTHTLFSLFIILPYRWIQSQSKVLP